MRLLGRGDVIAPCKSSDDEASPDATLASAAAQDDGSPPPPSRTDPGSRPGNQARPKLHAMLLKEDAQHHQQQQQQQQGHANSVAKKKAGMGMGIAGSVKNRFVKGGSGKQEQALPGIASAKPRPEPAAANVARKAPAPAITTTTTTGIGSTNPRAPKKRAGPTASSPTHALPNGATVPAATASTPPSTPAAKKERTPTGRQSLSPRNALVSGRGFLQSPEMEGDGRMGGGGGGGGTSPRFVPRRTPPKSKSGELGPPPARVRSGDGQGRSKSGELGLARPLVFEVKRNPGPGQPGMHELQGNKTSCESAVKTPASSSSSKSLASASASGSSSHSKSGGAAGVVVPAAAVAAAGIAMDAAACSAREEERVPEERKKAAVVLNLQDLEAGRGTDFDSAQYDFAPGQPEEAAAHAQEGRQVQLRGRGRATPSPRPSNGDSDSDGDGSGAFDPFCIPAGEGAGLELGPGPGPGGNTPTKPHKANDPNWEAVRSTRSRDGAVGLSHFSLLKRLGCGDIGSVYLAELRGTACYFAMKVMDKGALENRKKQERAQTEREILESLDHPFLPTLYAHFDTPQFTCLVMEFCPGGDLHSLRQTQPGKRFANSAARFYAAEVLLALEYLHMMGVVYRDLKPENVLVRKDGHIMLSDFDLSLKCDVSPTLLHWNWNSPSAPSSPMSPLKRASFSFSFSAYNHHVLSLTSCIMPACRIPSCSLSGVPGSPRSPRLARRNSGASSTCSSSGGGIGAGMGLSGSFRRKHVRRESFSSQVVPLPELVAEPTEARSMSFVGTHEYLAPEIISGEGHGSAVDWWTFGIFLFELLYGKTPFRGADNQGTLRNVLTQALRFPEEPGSSEEQDDEEDDDVVCQDAKALIKGLLAKDPHKRLGSARGAAEIKAHPFFDCVNWALIRCATPPEVPKPFRPPDSVSTVGGRTPPSSPVAARGEAPEVDFGDVF